MEIPAFRLFGYFAMFSIFFCNSQSYTFTIRNRCPHTIWPGTLAGSGRPPLPTTGFKLESGRSVKIVAPSGWSGRIWARTGCTFDELGVGTCQTGDCGGRVECNGMGNAPPATLFEITLGKGQDKDFYDISVVDGYNLPIVAVARPTIGRCNYTSCVANLNLGCPKELQVVNTAVASTNTDHVVGCKSACEAFGTDEYCCSREFANPNTCRPSYYSVIFKKACPKAYSYAFDDAASTFTCKAADYTITFCPRTKGLRQNNSSPAVPPIHGLSNGQVRGIPSSSTRSGRVVDFINILPLYLYLLFLVFSF